MTLDFTVRTTAGRADLCLPSPNQPGSGRSPLVTVARDDDFQSALVLMGRLHYCEGLAAWLPPRCVTGNGSDADLALGAYRHGGTRGLERLEGEFSLVVWDARKRELIGMRDPFGAWPLFWSTREAGCTMGTCARACHPGPASPRWNIDYLAEYLARPYVTSELPSEQTVFQGVQRVMPGTIVRLKADGQLRWTRYWDWASRIECAQDMRLEDVAERFRHLLQQAVVERTRQGRIAAHLSGGMDSSSIAVLATRGLADSPEREHLLTISLTYQAAELAGERAYIQSVLDQEGAARGHFIHGDAAIGFDWFEHPVPHHEEPYSGLWELSTHRMLVDAAEQHGAETILTGLGADQIVACRPLHIADRLRRGRWISAYREACRWARAENRGVWSVLLRNGLVPLVPTVLDSSMVRLLPLGGGRLTPIDRFSPPPWLPNDFVRQHHVRERAYEAARRIYASPAQRSADLAMLELSVGDWVRRHLVTPHGMEITHPFRDPRLVGYALGIPAQVRTVPGQPKPVLQAAMRGLLPETVRTRQGKRGFDGPHARGLARNLPQIEDMVRRSRIRDLGMLVPDQVLPTLRRAAAGVRTPAAEHLDRTLALVAWFDQA